jgi:hypothetical protein
VKYYEFVDKAPALGKLIVIEGVERLFSERAIATIVERLLEPGERDLNLDRFIATEVDSFRVVEAAISALPFLGNTRVVVVRGAHDLRADPRRALAEVAKRVPDGNTLIIEDLVSPASKRPEPLGKLLGRAVERIDREAMLARVSSPKRSRNLERAPMRARLPCSFEAKRT